MIKVVTPTDIYFPNKSDEYFWNNENDEHVIKIFLAGTIDNGDSENWQNKLIDTLLFFNADNRDLGEDLSLGNLIIYNPRREYWHADILDEELEKQIKWEQDHLDTSDIIVMYLADNSKSPVSLLELGLYGPQGKMIVFCTNKFYRYMNVKLTCDKYYIPMCCTNNIDNVCSVIADTYDMLKEIV